RIAVQHNCLLLQATGNRQQATGGENASARLPSPRLALIGTGSGDKLDAKSKDIFELEDRSILGGLREEGSRPEDVELVATTHQHFDHSGGLTRLARAGETPDWAGPGSDGKAHGVKLSFPNAAIFTQAREWADALANRSVMTRTYF